jgi:Ca2+-dependent lipid-binding protein
VWNKVFFIPVSSMGDELTLTCYDEDKLSNDVVGEVQIPMYSLCRNGGVRDWFDIIYKKKTSGKILIESNYKPPGDAIKNDGRGSSSLFSNL